jgi:hypothetical protein
MQIRVTLFSLDHLEDTLKTATSYDPRPQQTHCWQQTISLQGDMENHTRFLSKELFLNSSMIHNLKNEY